MNVAKYIYETPDTWGEVTFGSETAIRKVLAESIEAGGLEWKNASLDECARWEYVTSVGDTHMYEMPGRAYGDPSLQFIVVTHIGDGYYDRRASFRSEDDARDYAADQ